jgi:hypothetical protein
MSAQLKTLVPFLAGAIVLAFAGSASASCGSSCHPKPPPPPPPKPCCQHKPPQKPPTMPNNPNVNVHVNVNATAVAISKANANATSNSNSNSGSSSSSDSFFFGGGGAQVIATPGFPVLQPLNVIGSELAKKAITEKRSIFKQVIVQAVCIDDRGAPHPASQLFPDRDVAEHFQGEIFRCIAGTRLQATIADFMGKVAFDGGQTLACAKGEALYHSAGTLTCRPATPQRNCFERSLLRRHGVGVKVFKMTKIEEFTSFREEIVEASHSSVTAFDGGVGGFVH